MPHAEVRRWLERLGSVQLAIVWMASLMALVLACTLDQTRLGTFGAVEAWIRTWWVRVPLPGFARPVPLLPGGGLIGLLFALNLAAGLLVRLEWRSRRIGLLLAHAGVLLLVVGEFVTAAFSDEALMPVEVGATRSWAEHPRKFELAIVDGTDARRDRVWAVSDRKLRAGGEVRDLRLPFTVRITSYAPNARLVVRGKGAADAEPLLEAVGDDEANTPAARVSCAGKAPVLVAADQPAQVVTRAGRRYSLSLRAARRALPFSLTLKEFTHEVYPGTDIPRNFASLVHLADPGTSEERDVLIWMNHPLRHGGLTFYQASYGKGDTLSIFQVVRNPGWTLPYLSCTMVAAGLAWHFLLLLMGSRQDPGARRTP